LRSIYLYVIINDVNLCDDTHHLNAVLKTTSWGTNVSLRATWFPWAPCWWPCFRLCASRTQITWQNVFTRRQSNV